MTFTGPVYRPPVEAESLLLQVTVGCAHNKCTFCTMYRDTRFSIEPFEQIVEDLKEARKIYKTVKRVFLVNGDAFVLSADRLTPIAEKIIEFFPEVEVISMYASINNIRTKTDEELKDLRALRINELWIGVETAYGEALDYLNKGFSIEDSRTHLKRLNRAGMDFYYGFIYGAAGRGRGIKNAVENAALINEVKPMGLAPTSMEPNEGSPLMEDVNNGIFVQASEQEIFDEMRKTIELIDAKTIYYGRHIINTIPFDCILPRDKEKALAYINDRIETMDKAYLASVPKRHSI